MIWQLKAYFYGICLAGIWKLCQSDCNCLHLGYSMITSMYGWISHVDIEVREWCSIKINILFRATLWFTRMEKFIISFICSYNGQFRNLNKKELFIGLRHSWGGGCSWFLFILFFCRGIWIKTCCGNSKTVDPNVA